MHHLNKRLLFSDKGVSDRPNRREGTSPNVTKGCREHPIACSQVNVSMFSTALPVPGQLSGDLLSVHSVCCSKHWTSDDSWSSDAFLSAGAGRFRIQAEAVWVAHRAHLLPQGTFSLRSACFRAAVHSAPLIGALTAFMALLLITFQRSCLLIAKPHWGLGFPHSIWGRHIWSYHYIIRLHNRFIHTQMHTFPIKIWKTS